MPRESFYSQKIDFFKKSVLIYVNYSVSFLSRIDSSNDEKTKSIYIPVN